MESSGIYKIVNQVDGKFYIGSAISFRKRWNAHRSGLKRKMSESIRKRNLEKKQCC